MTRFCFALVALAGVFCFGGFVGDRLAGLAPAPPDPKVMYLENENLDLRVRLDQARRAATRLPAADLIPPTNLPTIPEDDLE